MENKIILTIEETGIFEAQLIDLKEYKDEEGNTDWNAIAEEFDTSHGNWIVLDINKKNADECLKLLSMLISKVDAPKKLKKMLEEFLLAKAV